MKFNILNRKIHYWASIVVALPILVIISTGILLQLKKDFTWVQPAEQRGTGKEPEINLSQVLEICRGVPDAQVQSWADINRIDVRPSRGMLKVWAKNNWEVQIDARSGEVLQVAYRRSDIIESIHDGSWFHDTAKIWIFLPAGIILLGLWLTGMWLFFLPIVIRRRKRLKTAEAFKSNDYKEAISKQEA
jgi:uncharacterized iron-regulated membrane protein